MADLMEIDSVKSAYKKYIIALHPDRVVSSSDNNKIYLANRIFTTMTDAFNAFKKENGLK
jgi:DnaJ-class molecular chaperone